ncbi:MAG: hypothetical protein LBT95_05905 [Treponema sp.]|jgi:hypothetical protein|nr:hypothetical protein [Treponema sp.]
MNSVKSFIKIPLPALATGGILFVFSLLSCKQQPIFYEISLELEPVAARINGATTNIVIFDGKMYVAGEGFHQYARDENTGKALWNNVPSYPPGGGKIRSLAATNDYLYAVTGELEGSALYRKTKDSPDWERVENNTGYPFLQTIFGNETGLFVGAAKKADKKFIFAIFYDNNGKLELIKEETQLLKGAVWDGTDHFLAVSGGTTNDGEGTKGIYKVSQGMGDPELTGGSGDWLIEGLIKTGSRIVAVSRKGAVYAKDAGDESFTEKAKTGLTFTGALALYQKDGNGLLLFGVQGGSGAGGYREIRLSDIQGESWTIRSPGESKPSSVSSAARYHSSIASHPVNYIFQAPPGLDPEQTLFASTQKNGLWSYRMRNGEEQWNGES